MTTVPRDDLTDQSANKYIIIFIELLKIISPDIVKKKKLKNDLLIK